MYLITLIRTRALTTQPRAHEANAPPAPSRTRTSMLSLYMYMYSETLFTRYRMGLRTRSSYVLRDCASASSPFATSLTRQVHTRNTCRRAQLPVRATRRCLGARRTAASRVHGAAYGDEQAERVARLCVGRRRRWLLVWAQRASFHAAVRAASPQVPICRWDRQPSRRPQRPHPPPPPPPPSRRGRRCRLPPSAASR